MFTVLISNTPVDLYWKENYRIIRTAKCDVNITTEVPVGILVPVLQTLTSRFAVHFCDLTVHIIN